MAEKLSVRIALQGGAEIERQLADIGEAGQKAFAEIEQSASQVGGFKNLDPQEVTAKLKDMGVTGADAIDKIQQAVKSAGRFETLVLGTQALENGLAKAGQAALALGRAAIPIGVVLVGAIAAATKATISFADAINKASDAAVQLGLSIEKFDQLRGSLEAAGISGKGVSEILQRMGQAAQQADLSKVTQAIKELKENLDRGFGAQGTAQLKTLMEAAKGVGPAADAAREALVKLGLVNVDPQGVPIIEGLPQTLAQLTASTGSAEQGLAAFVEQLRQMPAGVQQSALAVQAFGPAAGELVRALNSGAISADQFKQKVQNLITPEQAGKAAELGQAIARLESASNRFGGVTFAPLITTQINLIATALQNLQTMINNFSWGTVVDGILSLGNALKTLTISGVVSQGLQTIFGNAQQATQAVQQTNQKLQQTGQAAAQAGQQAAQGGQAAATGLTAWQQVAQSLEQQGRTTGQTFQQAGQQAAQGAEQGKSAWATLPAAVDQAIASVTNFISTMSSITWEAISAGVAAWKALTDAIQGAIDRLLRFLGLRGGAPAGQGAPGKASGGLLGGRGTGTSDSNLAWVSRGEYITPARAVAQPGVLAFLEALRRSGGNLSRVLNGMGRFALGGMVPRAIPAFASGGLAGGSNNVTIQFPGLPEISGLRASSSVVDELRKAAALAQVRSGGRKPSRYS